MRERVSALVCLWKTHSLLEAMCWVVKQSIPEFAQAITNRRHVAICIGFMTWDLVAQLGSEPLSGNWFGQWVV